MIELRLTSWPLIRLFCGAMIWAAFLTLASWADEARAQAEVVRAH